MKNKFFFKALFWFLIAVVFCFIGLFTLRIGSTIIEATRIEPGTITIFAVLIIIIAAVFIGISAFVYSDAPKRGMDRWMWMTIAVFVPNFIGLLIYFIVRSSNNAKCIQCGKNIKSEFKVCPYCSTPLDVHCPACGKQISAGWQVCPHCRQDITDYKGI